jgi:hypothetical protein
MRGRGALGRWGPNEAADPIVTRFNDNGQLQFLAVKRKDTGIWAIPGGMLKEGEDVSQALRRLFEYALHLNAPESVKHKRLSHGYDALLDRLMATPAIESESSVIAGEGSLSPQEAHQALNKLFDEGAMIYCGCALVSHARDML